MATFEKAIKVKYGSKLPWLKEKIDNSHEYWEIKDAQATLIKYEKNYLENKTKKWIFAVGGCIVLAVVGYYIAWIVFTLSHTTYGRENINARIEEIFGTTKFDEVLSDELMLIGYAWNKEEPRFYTKESAKINPSKYDILLSQAIGGVSATPSYFPPMEIGDETIIDGSVIANNPSTYAFIYAHHQLGEEKVRIVSLGTGKNIHKDIS